MSLKLFFQYLKEKLFFVDEIYAPELIDIIKSYSSPIVFLVSWVVWGIFLSRLSLDRNISLILFVQYPILIIAGYMVWRDYLDWLDQKTIVSIREIEEPEENRFDAWARITGEWKAPCFCFSKEIGCISDFPEIKCPCSYYDPFKIKFPGVRK